MTRSNTNYRTAMVAPTAGDSIREAHSYEYDNNGNILYVNTSRVKPDMIAQPDTVQRAREERFRWDEENRLTALSQNGYVSHYWYDADGERDKRTVPVSQYCDILRILISLCLLLVLLFTLSCSDNNIIKSKGLLIQGLHPERILFVSETRGFLVGYLTEFDGSTIDNMRDPKHPPQPNIKTVIFQTLDGGHNWAEVCSIPNTRISKISNIENNRFYLVSCDNNDDYTQIITYDINKNQAVPLFHVSDAISAIWSANEKLFYSVSHPPYIMVCIDADGNDNNVNLNNYILEGICVQDIVFGILNNKTANCFTKIGNQSQSIDLPLDPKHLCKTRDSNVLIAGYANNPVKHTRIGLYDIASKSLEIVSSFDDYSIIGEMQSCDNYVVATIGNGGPFFNTYDLAYSTDSGHQWRIVKLNESIISLSLVYDVVYVLRDDMNIIKVDLHNP